MHQYYLTQSTAEQGRFLAPHKLTWPGLGRSLFTSNWAVQANSASLLSSILPPHPRALRSSEVYASPSPRQSPHLAQSAEHLARLLQVKVFWRGTEFGEGKGNRAVGVTPVCRCFASQLPAFRVFSIHPPLMLPGLKVSSKSAPDCAMFCFV